jgi:5-methylcytosine-specific restriction endonuclease McrA
MPSKRELLSALNVTALRKLAKENKVSLVTEDWLGGEQKATRKEDILDVLSKSSKVTKKKIEAKMGTSSKKSSSKGKATSGKVKRRSLLAGEKTQVKKRQKYKCKMCKRDLSKLAVVNYDHIKPIASKGSNNLSNFQALCPNCHAEKTQQDRVKIARARRQAKKVSPPKKPVKKKPPYTCKQTADYRSIFCGKRKASKSCMTYTIFGDKCEHLRVSRK